MQPEITNNQEFEAFVIEYGVRFHNCQQFTVNDLMIHLPSANKTVVSYKLQDLAIKGTLKRINQDFYYVPDSRELDQKVLDCFANRYTYLTIDQLSRTLKQREDHIREAVKQLVKDGKLTQCPFIGGSWWLAE